LIRRIKELSWKSFSANLSQKGFTYNCEMALYVEETLADEAAGALERLIINGVARKI
jgi:hypothetical protein